MHRLMTIHGGRIDPYKRRGRMLKPIAGRIMIQAGQAKAIAAMTYSFVS